MRILVAFLLVLATFGSAEAQTRRGTVLDFSGWRGSAARNAVVRGLRNRLDLVSSREVAGTGADLSTPAGIANAARSLALTVFVQGEVQGRGSRARTVIHVFDANGNEVAMREGPAPLGGARLGRVSRAAGEALDQALVSIERREAEEREAERLREEEEARAAAAAAAAEAASMESEEEEEDEVDGENRLPILVALVGLDLRTRNAGVNLEGGGGRDYEAGLFPSLTLQLQSFPLRGMGGAAAGLYAQFDFGISLGLTSQELDLAGNPGPELSTTSMQLGIHVGYLYPLEDDVARIGALVGFGIDSFSIDDNGTMPSSKYTFLRAGLAADARLYDNLLRVRADFGYRITFGVGDLEPTFGESASAGGFDFGLGMHGQLDFGLTYGLRFGFTKFSTDFSGVASGDHPATATATSLSDRSIQIGLQLGYAL
ncbi:MAG: hypothetical protein KC586_01620 [Myxococcales bacterium]|nr:hypothetical protein [Myxococcales bacterium]